MNNVWIVEVRVTKIVVRQSVLELDLHGPTVLAATLMSAMR